MTSQKYDLQAQPRTITGRKVKLLRAQGILPAHVYGEGVTLTIQLSESAFRSVYNEAGETGLVYLRVEGEKTSIPVLIVGVTYAPVKGEMLHVDFRKVNLTETLQANVPIEVVGESPAVENGGVLVQIYNELLVEALPTNLPESFVIDVSTLTEIGQDIKISDLKYDRSLVEVKLDQDEMIMVVNAPEAEEIEAPEAETAEGPETASSEAAGDDVRSEEKDSQDPAKDSAEDSR